MKKGILLMFLFCYFNAFSGSGIFQTYVIINVSGSGNAYYAGGANADGGTSWASQSFTTPSSLILNGGEVKTYKNGCSDVTGAKINYRVYKDGATPGSFTELDLPYDSELGSDNQKWSTTGANVDILAMATSTGTWKIEIYWKVTSSDGDHYDSNGGGNIIASFTVTSLPVELTKFQATPRSKSVVLAWQTATEKNNSHFVVEQSKNGSDFRAIGEVAGAGTTIELQNYQFTDENPANGMNYYRLKQVDFDGAMEYSDVVAVEMATTKSVGIYPNPVKDRLLIKTDLAEDVNVQIFNMQGQLVRQWNSLNLAEKQGLNVSELQGGVYQLQILSAVTNAIVQQQKIVVVE